MSKIWWISTRTCFSGLKIFDKETSDGAVKVVPNRESPKELRKTIIKNFEQRTVYSTFTDNIWGADLADVQLLSKFSIEICFLLCVTDVFSKYGCVVPLVGKRGITITDAFYKILDESRSKPNKIWFDRDSEFYNKSVKLWLEKKWYRNVFNP